MAKRVSRADLTKERISKEILSIAGRYTPYNIFADWIECCALSIVNTVTAIHGQIWQDREKQYNAIMQKYNEEERSKFPVLFNILVEELENDPRDVLGEAFMRGGLGSDEGGQFFTPFSISRMMSDISVSAPEEGEKVSLNEPSCGSGGSIIAAALTLKDMGVNFQKTLKVVAQDLDWRCVYMCYVQLSLMGIDAICVQGDTLMDPYHKGYPERRMLRTPANMGVLI